jgi:hypothetical protein
MNGDVTPADFGGQRKPFIYLNFKWNWINWHTAVEAACQKKIPPRGGIFQYL